MSTTPTEAWTPSSWRTKPAAQDVEYPDTAHLERVLKKIKHLPPLVTPSEIERLRHQLASVQRNEAFLLHAGDCAESFDAVTHENISNKIGLILSFSLILIWGARLPVVRIGRIAGQYAKPRSSPTEKIKIPGEGGEVQEREVLSFRGDNVNGLDPNERTPDPDRLLSAYFHSTATLNYIRALLTSGFASLQHPRDWSLSHVRSPELKKEFERITEGLADALDFTHTIGLISSSSSSSSSSHPSPSSSSNPTNVNPNPYAKGVLGEVDFYTSHEGLMLPYEEAMTREFSLGGSTSRPHPPLHPSTSSTSSPHPHPNHHHQNFNLPNHPHETQTQKPPTAHYNTSAHFLWIGDRTRQLTGAHVEYFRGIRNPVGVKVGPSMGVEEVVRLLDIINPEKESGRVTLITRYGAGKVEQFLPGHIKAVQESGHPVIWICDPMHGNTQTSSSGLKTRHFGTIISELTSVIRTHAAHGSRLGGVSLEFTGELAEDGFSVTECVGGSMGLGESELGLRYQSFCDPRLNFEQSMDVAFLISNHFKRERLGRRLGDDVLFEELGGRSPA